MHAGGRFIFFCMGDAMKLWFTEKDMETLLEVYDAYGDMLSALRMINGGASDTGIIGRMGKIEDLFQNLSPVYNPDENVSDDSVFWHALMCSDMEMSERVSVLMGDAPAGS